MPFADEMISQDTAERLVEALEATGTSGPLRQLRTAAAELADLGLRARVDTLADALLADVGADYGELAELVRTARTTAVDFSGWMIWPVTTAVADRAVSEGTAAAFDDAMDLLAELTGLLTSEFAVRTLLRHDLDRALARIIGWSTSQDEQVRRLATEGTRPYLPWAIRVPDLTHRRGATAPILDALYRDPSEYVRRSVANHLNDLSRDDPDLVVRLAAQWLADADENTAWVVRHGLRTLIKRGDPGALAVLGFSAPADSVEIDGPHLDARAVAIGGSIELRARIRNVGTEAVRLAIDYVVHHHRPTGVQAAKVFKLTTATLQPGKEIQVRRGHSFRVITTRRYHPGPHGISLQVNGVATATVSFELTDDLSS